MGDVVVHRGVDGEIDKQQDVVGAGCRNQVSHSRFSILLISLISLRSTVTACTCPRGLIYKHRHHIESRSLRFNVNTIHILSAAFFLDIVVSSPEEDTCCTSSNKSSVDTTLSVSPRRLCASHHHRKLARLVNKYGFEYVPLSL